MGFAAIAAPLVVGVASIAVSVGIALPAPRPGQPATMLLLPGMEQGALAALVNLDPDMRLLTVSAGGLVLTVQYARADLPAHLAGTGVVAVIGAGAIGCR